MAESAKHEVNGVELRPEFVTLTKLIRQNKYPGDFFCSGVLPLVPDIHFTDAQKHLDPSFSKTSQSASANPAISVKDLIGLCSQAPYGRGEETVVDKDVRSCLELNPDKFRITRTAPWVDAIADVKESACTALVPGLPLTKAELRLYKLLVYKKGSHFLPHRDTQRDENHFGTVVISLPVKHSGGALYVRHMGEERIHKTESGRTSKQCQWTAFFTDVEHEIKEITSGHRIALVYHLYRTGNAKLESPVSNKEHPIVKSLQKIQEYLVKIDNEELKYIESSKPFKEYDEEDEDLGPEQYSHAGYVLEHKYTPSSLKPENLKGRDAFLYQLLSGAGFELRLAAIEVRVDSSGPDDEGWCDLGDLMDEFTKVEFSELDTTAPSVTDSCSGGWGRGKKRKMFPSRPMEEVTWLVEDVTKHAQALKRVDKYIQGTGNEGCDWHSTYLTSALLINLMPGNHVAREFSVEHTRRSYPDFGP